MSRDGRGPYGVSRQSGRGQRARESGGETTAIYFFVSEELCHFYRSQKRLTTAVSQYL
jgi:hypothetical protein